MKVKDIESNDVKFRDILRRIALSKVTDVKVPIPGHLPPNALSSSGSLHIYAGDNITEPVMVLPDDWETLINLVKLLIDDRYANKDSQLQDTWDGTYQV